MTTKRNREADLLVDIVQCEWRACDQMRDSGRPVDCTKDQRVCGEWQSAGTQRLHS